MYQSSEREMRASGLADERSHPPSARHRYPTRWKLRRHSTSLSQAPNVGVNAQDQRKEARCCLYLSREIIFNILVFVPAQVLHEVARYVCKEWNDIVRDPLFIEAHHLMSSVGFLIQHPHMSFQAYLIHPNPPKLKVTDIRLPFRARILSSLNGLFLVQSLTNPQIFHLINPVTGVKLSLPPLVGLDKLAGFAGFAVTSSGHYKVVYVLDDAHCIRAQPSLTMRVITVGVDKAWRFIHLQGMTVDSTGLSLEMLQNRPYFVGEFIYWFDFRVSFGLALNVDTEIIYEYYKPDCVKYSKCAWSFGMGKDLALIKVEEEIDIWRLWKLTDVKSSQWTEVAGLNMSVVRCWIHLSFFVDFWPAWLIAGNFWFYSRSQVEHIVICRYNLSDGSLVSFPIKSKFTSALYPYVPTLVSPKSS